MFEHQGLLENRDRSRRIDQPPLFLGSLPSLVEPLRCGYRRQAFVHQPDRYAAPGCQPCSPLPRLCRSRTLPTAQAARQADEHLDRLVLSDDCHQLGNLIGTGPDRRQRIRQHAAGVTRSHPDPRISPIDRKSHAAPEPFRSSVGKDPGECAGTHVHVRSCCDTHVATRVGRKEQTCTFVPNRSRAFPGDPGRGPSIKTRCWSGPRDPRTKARGSAAGRRKPKMPETCGPQTPLTNQTQPPRFRRPAAEPVAEGLNHRAA